MLLRLPLVLLLPVSLFALPSHFEPNHGQYSANVLFAGRNVAFTTQGPVFRPGIRLSLTGAAHVAPRAASPLPGHTDYLLRAAHARVPHYSEIRYPAVYPGIDLVFHDSEYDFSLAPGADPRVIRMRFPGASRVALEGDTLVVDSLRHPRPLAWQESNGSRLYVDVRYRLLAGEVRFDLGVHDRNLPLIIDPVVTWATYAGGTGSETGSAVAVDSAGNTYLGGSTDSPDFAAIKGGVTTGVRGFLSKLDAAGANVTAITVIGGATIDGLALDASGNAVVVGAITGSQFPGPTAGAFQTAGATGYVARFSQDATGFKLQFIATVVASPMAVALDSAGAIYATGAAGPKFQTTTGAAQITNGGGTCIDPDTGSSPCPDAFALKLSSDGKSLVYATFLGGNSEDTGRAIAVNSGGEAYIAGDTASADFPVTPGAAQTKFGGRVLGVSGFYGDAFVAKVNASASQFVFATYLGGAQPDIAYGIALDKTGSAYVAGNTQSADFPVSTGALQTKYGGGTPPADAADPSGDAFIAKFTTSGDRAWSTYLGGAGREIAEAISLDAAGNVYVAGTTESADFPFTAGAVVGCRTGGPFVAELDANGAKLLRATSTPGMGLDEPHALAVASESAVYVAGDIASRVFFASASAAQKTYGGGDMDAFVVRLDLAAAPRTYAACVLNAASFKPGNFAFFPLGTVAPGEIVSIFGIALGPDPPVLAQPAAGAPYPTSLGGTQVFFDGVPAPMWYVSPTQINAVVPYGIKPPVTSLTVQRGGITDGPRILPVAGAVPGIFTATQTGQGQAAVLNQDGSYNSVANPAPRGSTIVFYAVGAGVMTPAEIDGSVQPGALPLPKPQLPVTVQVRGADAKVVYAGAAPGYISGLLQVNVEVPTTIDFGNSVPLTLSIGSQPSQFNVTIAVK